MDSTATQIDLFLQPGEHSVADAGYRLRTLLGSCVSIILWHPAKRIGAMSHFLLPTRGNLPPGELDGRYAEEAMQLMIRDLAAERVGPHRCHGKLFGGGNMFPRQSRASTVNVGQKNGEAARSLLLAHRVPLISESLFGLGHRQIIFDVASGDVWSHQVAPGAPGPRKVGS
jgi:chemotaxis protein CheD